MASEEEGPLSESRPSKAEFHRDWKRLQDDLVQSERLATLGQLSAGIMHEIKNPLNFVTNFAKTSVELLSELDELLTPYLDGLEPADRESARELLDDLQSDIGSILKHGNRADAIIKSSLLLSRKGGGGPVDIDLNQLIQEALDLAYQGTRASDPTFQMEIDSRFDSLLQPVSAVPHDLIRVFINLFTNAFYAAKKQKDRNHDPAFQPTLKVSTNVTGDGVEIRIRDNGTGIPVEGIQNLFQPFYTTKPAGEGTGLGLSISHEIITRQHTGRIEVDSREGEYTEFQVWLPVRSRESKPEPG